MRRRYLAITLLVYLAVGLAAFAPILTAQLVSDDWDFLLIVSRARSARVAFEPLVGRFVRPLVVLTYYVNYKVFGLWPFPYHLTVVLLHVLSAWLVCLLAERVDTRRRRLVGFASGLLFLLFAGHSEAVSWVAGVADPALTPFIIGSLLCLGRALEREHPARFVVLGWALFGGALLAKETAAVFPALALAFGLLEVWRAGDRRRTLRRTLVFVSVPAVLVASLFFTRAAMFGSALGAYSGLGTSEGRLLIQTGIFFARTFVPPLPLMARAWLTPMTITLAGVVTVMGAAIVFTRARDRAALVFATAAVVISLVPVLPLTIALSSTESERYVYLPSVFSSILIVLAVVEIVQVRAVAATCIGAVLAFNVVFLERSNRLWAEAGALFDSILHTSIAIVRQHDPALRSMVFALNLPDTLRGAYVLRNGFVPALRLLAPDLNWTPSRVIGIASHSTAEPHDVTTVVRTMPLEFRIDLHDNVLFRQPPIAHPLYTFPEWAPNSYTVRFAPALAKALVLHVSEGRMTLSAAIDGPGLPFGSLEIPPDGTTCVGESVRFSGWALDDEEVIGVIAERDASSGEPQAKPVELGEATWTPGTRPDVAAAFEGLPNANRSEWDFLLPCTVARSAPDRTVTVRVTAVDDRGHRVELGARTIRADAQD